MVQFFKNNERLFQDPGILPGRGSGARWPSRGIPWSDQFPWGSYPCNCQAAGFCREMEILRKKFIIRGKKE